MPKRDYYDDPDAPEPNSIVPAVVAVVFDDQGRLLVIHRTDNDKWALPGGAQDFGENLAGAVRREVEEETGIIVEPVDIIGTYTDPIFDYPHAEPVGGGAHGCAIIGGFVARNTGYGDAYGRYLYADNCTGEIRSLLPALPFAAR